MNNKEFIAELSRRLGYTVKDASSLMVALVTEMTDELEDENVIAIQNIGSFEVRKKTRAGSREPRYPATHVGASQISH